MAEPGVQRLSAVDKALFQVKQACERLACEPSHFFLAQGPPGFLLRGESHIRRPRSVTAQVYAWGPLRLLITKLLTKHECLRLWGHLIARQYFAEL